MTLDPARQDVAKFAMTALSRAADSWAVAGGNELTTILLVRQNGDERLHRVDMDTPEDSLSTARSFVMNTEGVEAYAIAYLGHVAGERNDFRFDAIGNVQQTILSGRQPAIVVEAGNAEVDKSGALAMACLILQDEQGIYLEDQPSHFTGSANWLGWREILPEH